MTDAYAFPATLSQAKALADLNLLPESERDAALRVMLTQFASAEMADRYLAEPVPRPSLQVRVCLPANVDNVTGSYSFVAPTSGTNSER